MNARIFSSAVAITLLISAVSFSDVAQGYDCAVPKPLPQVVLPGLSWVSGGVPRGMVDCWTFKAQEGAPLALSISSFENNAVFQIYEPGWSTQLNGTVPWGYQLTINAQSLPGAGEMDDAVSWHGIAPKSGAYLITVGAIRGGSDYCIEATAQSHPDFGRICAHP